jgi:predicted glutamine amidotransferase
MCRLFGLHGGERRVSATFWLVESPFSLMAQSRTQPDGFGIGTFEEDGSPDVDKRPIRALGDDLYAREACEERSRTFVAHLRFASTGRPAEQNTHPFEQQGRLFAHNGVFWGLDALEEHLGEDLARVQGDTDSERLFALITREIERHGGDVGEGICAAIRWIADTLPVYSLNFVLATPTELWALRYPEGNELFAMERADDCGSLDERSTTGSMRVVSPELSACRSVVIATEKMDDDPAWRLLEVGELLHVPADLACISRTVVDRPPTHHLTLDDLDRRSAESQTADQVAAGRDSDGA